MADSPSDHAEGPHRASSPNGNAEVAGRPGAVDPWVRTESDRSRGSAQQVDPWADARPREREEAPAPAAVAIPRRRLLSWQLFLFLTGCVFALAVRFGAKQPGERLIRLYGEVREEQKEVLRALDDILPGEDESDARDKIEDRLEKVDRRYRDLDTGLARLGVIAPDRAADPEMAELGARIALEHGRVLLALAQHREGTYANVWWESPTRPVELYRESKALFTTGLGRLADATPLSEEERREIRAFLAEATFGANEYKSAISLLEPLAATDARAAVLLALAHDHWARTLTDAAARTSSENAALAGYHELLKGGAKAQQVLEASLRISRLMSSRAERLREQARAQRRIAGRATTASDRRAQLLASAGDLDRDARQLLDRSLESLRPVVAEAIKGRPRTDFGRIQLARLLYATGRPADVAEAERIIDKLIRSNPPERDESERAGLARRQIEFVHVAGLARTGLLLDDDNFQDVRHRLDQLLEIKRDAVGAAGLALRADLSLRDARRLLAGDADDRTGQERLREAARAYLALPMPGPREARAGLLPATASPARMGWLDRDEALHAARIRERLEDVVRALARSTESDALVRTLSATERLDLHRRGRIPQREGDLRLADDALVHLTEHAGAQGFDLTGARRRALLRWRAHLHAERTALAETERSQAFAARDFETVQQVRKRLHAAQEQRARVLVRLADDPPAGHDPAQLRLEAAREFERADRPELAALHYKRLRDNPNHSRKLLAHLGLLRTCVRLGRYEALEKTYDDIVEDVARQEESPFKQEAEYWFALGSLRGAAAFDRRAWIERSVKHLRSLLARLCPENELWRDSRFLIGHAWLALADTLETEAHHRRLKGSAATSESAPSPQEETVKPDQERPEILYRRAAAALSDALGRFPLDEFRGRADWETDALLLATFDLGRAYLGIGRETGEYLQKAANILQWIEGEDRQVRARLGGTDAQRAAIAPRAAAYRAAALYEMALRRHEVTERTQALANALRAAEQVAGRYPDAPTSGHMARLADLCRMRMGQPADFQRAQRAFRKLTAPEHGKVPESRSALFWLSQAQWEAELAK